MSKPRRPLFKLQIVLMISNLMIVTGVLGTMKPQFSKWLTLNPTLEHYFESVHCSSYFKKCVLPFSSIHFNIL